MLVAIHKREFKNINWNFESVKIENVSIFFNILLKTAATENLIEMLELTLNKLSQHLTSDNQENDLNTLYWAYCGIMYFKKKDYENSKIQFLEIDKRQLKSILSEYYGILLSNENERLEKLEKLNERIIKNRNYDDLSPNELKYQIANCYLELYEFEKAFSYFTDFENVFLDKNKLEYSDMDVVKVYAIVLFKKKDFESTLKILNSKFTNNSVYVKEIK